MFYFVSATTTMAAFGLFDLGILLAAAGSSMFMIKFLGLCGTAMESKWITRFVPYIERTEIFIVSLVLRLFVPRSVSSGRWRSLRLD